MTVLPHNAPSVLSLLLLAFPVLLQPPSWSIFILKSPEELGGGTERLRQVSENASNLS